MGEELRMNFVTYTNPVKHRQSVRNPKARRVPGTGTGRLG
jgi:hypothetical protein